MTRLTVPIDGACKGLFCFIVVLMPPNFWRFRYFYHLLLLIVLFQFITTDLPLLAVIYK